MALNFFCSVLRIKSGPGHDKAALLLPLLQTLGRGCPGSERYGASVFSSVVSGYHTVRALSIICWFGPLSVRIEEYNETCSGGKGAAMLKKIWSFSLVLLVAACMPLAN